MNFLTRFWKELYFYFVRISAPSIITNRSGYHARIRNSVCNYFSLFRKVFTQRESYEALLAESEEKLAKVKEDRDESLECEVECEETEHLRQKHPENETKPLTV